MATSGDYKSYLSKLENVLDEYLVTKAPSLPIGLKDFIVAILPYLTIIFLIMALPIIFALVGISAFVLPFSVATGLGTGFNYIAGIAVTLITVVLEVMALPGLFKRQRKSWMLLYYVALIGGANSILSLSLWGLVIGTGISLYILFQIKSYYK